MLKTALLFTTLISTYFFIADKSIINPYYMDFSYFFVLIILLIYYIFLSVKTATFKSFAGVFFSIFTICLFAIYSLSKTLNDLSFWDVENKKFDYINGFLGAFVASLHFYLPYLLIYFFIKFIIKRLKNGI